MLGSGYFYTFAGHNADDLRAGALIDGELASVARQPIN